MTVNLPIGTPLRVTSEEGGHYFPVGTLVRVTRNPDPDCPLGVGEYLATTLDPYAEHEWAEGVTAFVDLSGDEPNAEVVEETIRDQAAIRASWDGDCPDVTRIVRRVGAALNSGRDAAVVEVVLDEVAKVRGTATDDELAHRLDWATGNNGRALLEQIRAEGLDVIAVRPEQANA